MSDVTKNVKPNINVLEFIRCPLCKSENLANRKASIICNECKSYYPIKENILILVAPKKQKQILHLWNKVEEFNGFEFFTTQKVSQLVKSYTTKKSISLDVGCGVGAYQKDFLGSVISFDFIPYFVKKAAEKFGRKNRIFIVADANEFPFKDNVFDFELCSQVVEHFTPKESEKLLKNMVRTTVGKVVVDTPNDGNVLIHKLRSFLYPGNPNEIYGKETDSRMLHHKLMGKSDLEKYGYSAHSCIGFVSRNRFRIGILWDLYDSFVWNFPDFGGNLVGIYTKKNNPK